MEEKITAYHGTTKENYNKIIKTGYFKKGTWFALNIEDSKEYGGEYIFQAEFDKEGFKGNGDWQFHLRNKLSLDELNAKIISKRK